MTARRTDYGVNDAPCDLVDYEFTGDLAHELDILTRHTGTNQGALT